MGTGRDLFHWHAARTACSGPVSAAQPQQSLARDSGGGGRAIAYSSKNVPCLSPFHQQGPLELSPQDSSRRSIWDECKHHPKQNQRHCYLISSSQEPFSQGASGNSWAVCQMPVSSLSGSLTGPCPPPSTCHTDRILLAAVGLAGLGDPSVSYRAQFPFASQRGWRLTETPNFHRR